MSNSQHDLDSVPSIDWDALIIQAREARGEAYAPYSSFTVGAALLADTGEIVRGCNVENATLGATCCAERTAVFAAIARGLRGFVAMAVVTDADEPSTSCGICRQVLFEFAPNMKIVFANLQGNRIERTPLQLLPDAFRLFRE